MVFDLAGRPGQITRLKLDYHEHSLRHLVFAADAKAGRGQKPEARVVFRMAQDNDGAEAELLAPFKSGAHKRGPKAFALMFGHAATVANAGAQPRRVFRAGG